MRKQGPHLKKLNFDESRVTFSVLKRRKKEELDTEGTGRMAIASILSVKAFI